MPISVNLPKPAIDKRFFLLPSLRLKRIASFTFNTNRGIMKPTSVSTTPAGGLKDGLTPSGILPCARWDYWRSTGIL